MMRVLTVGMGGAVHWPGLQWWLGSLLMTVVLCQILHCACSVASNFSFRLAVLAYWLVVVWVLTRAQGVLLVHRLGAALLVHT